MLNNKFQTASFVWLKFKPEIFMTLEAVVWRTVALKKFAIFIEKHLRRRLIFNTVASLPVTLSKKHPTQVFSCEL